MQTLQAVPSIPFFIILGGPQPHDSSVENVSRNGPRDLQFRGRFLEIFYRVHPDFLPCATGRGRLCAFQEGKAKLHQKIRVSGRGNLRLIDFFRPWLSITRRRRNAITSSADNKD
jgi:hypothetical protein